MRSRGCAGTSRLVVAALVGAAAVLAATMPSAWNSTQDALTACSGGGLALSLRYGFAEKDSVPPGNTAAAIVTQMDAISPTPTSFLRRAVLLIGVGVPVDVSVWECATASTDVVVTVNALTRSWNATQNFNATANPSPPFAYGYWEAVPSNQSDNVVTHLFDVEMSNADSVVWKSSVTHVLETPDATRYFGAVHGTLPGQLTLHPGCQANEVTVVRWTAPRSSTYVIGAWWGVGDTGYVEAFVYHNSTLLFVANVTTSDVQAVVGPRLVPQGDTIYIAVGVYQDCRFATTPVSLIIGDVNASVMLSTTRSRSPLSASTTAATLSSRTHSASRSAASRPLSTTSQTEATLSSSTVTASESLAAASITSRTHSTSESAASLKHTASLSDGTVATSTASRSLTGTALVAQQVFVVPSLTTATQTVVTITAVASVGNPTAGPTAGRISSLMSVLSCSDSASLSAPEEPLDTTQHPLRFALEAAGAAVRYSAASVLGNMSLGLVVIVLHALVTWLKSRSRDQTRFADAAAWTHFPGFTVQIHAYMVSLVAQSAMTCVIRGAALGIWIGAAGLLCCLGLVVAVLLGTVIVLPRHLRPRALKGISRQDDKGLLVWLFQPSQEWLPLTRGDVAGSRGTQEEEDTDIIVDCYGAFFDDYRFKGRWWMGVELLISVVSNALAGLGSTITCAVTAWASVVPPFLIIVLIGLVRPHLRRADFIASIFSDVLLLAGSLVAAVGTTSSGVNATTANVATWCAFAASIVLLVPLFYTPYRILTLYKAKRDRKRSRIDERARLTLLHMQAQQHDDQELLELFLAPTASRGNEDSDVLPPPVVTADVGNLAWIQPTAPRRRGGLHRTTGGMTSMLILGSLDDDEDDVVLPLLNIMDAAERPSSAATADVPGQQLNSGTTVLSKSHRRSDSQLSDDLLQALLLDDK